MPELPEVQTITDELNDILPKRKVVNLRELRNGTITDVNSILNFPFLIENVGRRGKYIVVETDSDFTIIIHLRMTGKLIYEDQLSEHQTHIRAIFDYEEYGHLVFDDIRTFGTIDVIENNEVNEFFTRIGVEPLSREFNAKYMAEKFAKRKSPIKNALLDQKIVAGLGNIYVCELLYRSGISPEIEANKLSLQQLGVIAKHTKEVLKEAIRENGTTISDYTRVDEKKGNFQNFLRVYQKEYCPKEHKISRIKQGGRATYYCPQCQKK